MARRKKNPRGKQDERKKEVEVNVDRDDVNSADMRGDKRAANCRKGGRSSDNDSSWYAHNPELLSDAGSFPFSSPVGTPIRNWYDGMTWGTDATVYNTMYSVPGILTINYLATAGGTEDGAVAPINMASVNIYSYIRSRNSGAKNYDSPNVMLYLLAMDSAYTFYAKLVRLYGIMQLASVYSRYLPQGLVTALNFDYADISGNLAQLRYLINQLAFKLGQLAVPNNLDFIKRHVWMESSLFTDSNTTKAQIYAYNAQGYYRYTEAVEGPSYLQCKSNNYMSMSTLTNIKNTMNDIIQPILESEDLAIISGDILKAFGMENLYVISPIAENYMTIPTYSPEVLSQIENTILIGNTDQIQTPAVPNNRYTWDIVENVPEAELGSPYLTQLITGKNMLTTALQGGNADSLQSQIKASDQLINMHIDNVKPEDVMVATRLSVIPTVTQLTSGTQKYYQNIYGTIGTEVALTMTITARDINIATGLVSFKKLTTDGIIGEALDGSQTIDTAKSLMWLEAFDWHPHAVYAMQSANAATTWVGELMDIDNYTIMTVNDLKRLHEVAVLSLFDCPQIAKLSKQPRG